jgi:hypothetical protein
MTLKNVTRWWADNTSSKLASVELFIVAIVKQKKNKSNLGSTLLGASQTNKHSPLFSVKFDQKNFPKIYPNQRLSTNQQKSKQMSYLDICFASMNRPLGRETSD